MAGSFWASISVQVNFSGTTWTDITAYVQGITAKRGRQYELDEPRAGSLNLALDNHDGRFDPSNAGSPYSPNVVLYKPIKVVCTNGSFSNTIFYGYVERWPQTYYNAGNWQMTPLIAVDIFGALKQKVFLSLVEEMIAQQNPSNLWWPLTSAAPTSNVTPERTAGIQNGQVATFGGNQQVSLGANPYANPAPGLEGLGGASFTPASPGWGYPHNLSVIRLETPKDGTYFQFPAVPWTLCMVIQTNVRPSTAANYNPMTFLEFTDSGGANANHTYSEFLRFMITSAGLLQVVAVDQDQAIFNTVFAAQLADGLPHFISIEMSTPTGGVPTLYFSMDNLGVATISSGNSINGWRWDQLVAMNLGATWPTNANGANSFSGMISEVCWFSGTLVTNGTFSGGASTNLPNAAINGLANQTADARIQTLMTLAGYGSKFTSLGTGNTAMQAAVISGKDAAALIIDTTKWEGGVVFSRGDGQLVFSPRSYRLNASPSLTIGDSASYPVSDLALSYDTSRLITQAEVSRTNGNDFVVNNTAAQAIYGIWTTQITDEGVATDNHALAQAQYLVAHYGGPLLRVEKLMLDAGPNQSIMNLVTGASGLAALELNQLLRIQHTPLGGHAVSWVGWVESINYTIGPDKFQITLDLSPQDTTTYLTCDGSAAAKLDTTTNILAF
ncbi:hypothetical protein [Nocardia jiangxiensis]|uniref:hypothetical protein n=1 Tax=Nocardia jiangxiensis TaxID=282685 RepID=UPI0003060302|nr:hypothetical protein [Nocardia jiangxiensis]